MIKVQKKRKGVESVKNNIIIKRVRLKRREDGTLGRIYEDASGKTKKEQRTEKYVPCVEVKVYKRLEPFGIS